MTPLIAIIVTYAGVTTALLLAFDREYGRASCWERDMFEVGQLLLYAPIVAVVLAVCAPVWLVQNAIAKLKASQS